MMQSQMESMIRIPEGCFEGDCRGCFYAKADVQSDGSVFCKEMNGYVLPEENKECSRYAGRWVTRLKAGIGIYLIITVVVIIIELLM